MKAALRWLASATPGSSEMLRLMDAAPVPCGTSAVTAKRSSLFGWAGYGYCPSHSRWYWGAKLLLICTCDGTVTGFGLANPSSPGSASRPGRYWSGSQPTGQRPAPPSSPTRAWPARTSNFLASDDLGLVLVRPARKDEKKPRRSPNWLRQRVEAIIWTLKNQLGIERQRPKRAGGTPPRWPRRAASASPRRSALRSG